MYYIVPIHLISSTCELFFTPILYYVERLTFPQIGYGYMLEYTESPMCLTNTKCLKKTLKATIKKSILEMRMFCTVQRVGQWHRLVSRTYSIVTFSFLSSHFQVAAPIFACAYLILEQNGEEGRMRAVAHLTFSDLLQVWHALGLRKLDWMTQRNLNLWMCLGLYMKLLSQESYSLQMDAIDTQTSALTRFVWKLCKVTFNLGTQFIFSRTLRN